MSMTSARTGLEPARAVVVLRPVIHEPPPGRPSRHSEADERPRSHQGQSFARVFYSAATSFPPRHLERWLCHDGV